MALYGQWKQAERKLVALTEASDRGLQKGIKEAAFGYQKHLVEGLRNDTLLLDDKTKVTLMSEPDKRNPLIRHGDFLRSIKAVKGGVRTWFVGVQKNAKGRNGLLYDIARFHEYGGTIRPKNRKSLSIPLTRKASRAGSPRNYPKPLTFLPAKKGNYVGLLVEKKETKNTLDYTPAYMLVRSVTIVKRPWRRHSWDQYKPIAHKVVADNISKALKQAI